MIYSFLRLECDRLKLAIIGQFLLFYVSPYKSKKSEFWKKWKNLLEISSFYTCVPKKEVWFQRYRVRDMFIYEADMRQKCGHCKNWEKQFFISGEMYFSYTERLRSAKFGKVLSLQRNDKKVNLLLIYRLSRSQRHIDRYLKNGVLKGIVHMIKYTNFQLCRIHPDGVI